MELDKDIKQQLAEFIADPGRVSSQDTLLLNELLQEYPYYQPLHLLLAKANMRNAEESNTLAKTALYTNGKLLHNFLFNETEITAEFNISSEASEIADEIPSAEELDEQEVFEEITEVDLSQYRPFKNTEAPEENAASLPETDETIAHKPVLEDELVFESIASSDFFAFEENFSPEVVDEQQHAEIPAPAMAQQAKEENGPVTDNSQISNYHDENLPYTFLWWLAKTRKEHRSVFQPYATPKKEQTNELQQQYIEHIFHVQSHLTGNETLPENIDHTKPLTKDFEIIENFIRKDPQINPPNAEQIDNENKARKSAEDQNDLVSETLANIYIEQMLYDKAIDTYQKLSLKFPEKSRYFADLIQSIEKKI